MRKCANIYPFMRRPLVIYDFFCNCSILNFLIYEENLIFFLISVAYAGRDVGQAQGWYLIKSLGNPSKLAANWERPTVEELGRAAHHPGHPHHDQRDNDLWAAGEVGACCCAPPSESVCARVSTSDITLIKKKNKFSWYIRKFWMEQLQSHMWGRAS